MQHNTAVVRDRSLLDYITTHSIANQLTQISKKFFCKNKIFVDHVCLNWLSI